MMLGVHRAGIYPFRRMLNDRETERLANLLGRIGDFNVTKCEPDTLRWRHNSDGQFTVNSAYKLEGIMQNNGQPKLWRNIWKCPAPIKVKRFLVSGYKSMSDTRSLEEKRGHLSLEMFLVHRNI